MLLVLRQSDSGTNGLLSLALSSRGGYLFRAACADAVRVASPSPPREEREGERRPFHLLCRIASFGSSLGTRISLGLPTQPLLRVSEGILMSHSSDTNRRTSICFHGSKA